MKLTKEKWQQEYNLMLHTKSFPNAVAPWQFIVIIGKPAGNLRNQKGLAGCGNRP